jgi:RNA polymerase sigma factor (sigma-70 family)
MKKYRKQGIKVHGKKRLVDVPVDAELYKADNREEYLRRVSRKKHVPLNDANLIGFTADVAEAYEEAQLLVCLRDALQALSDAERQLIECIYYDELTEKQTAKKLKSAQQTIHRKKHQIISKLRNSLKDWME